MKKYLLIASTFLLISCSSQLYVPSTNFGDVAAVENLTKGRTLYVNNCAGCHQLFLPNHYDATKWKKNLTEMQIRAKITDEQRDLIYEYLANAPK